MLLRVVAVMAGLGPAVLLVALPANAAQTAIALALGGLAVLVLVRAPRRSLAGAGVLLTTAAAVLAPSARALLPLTGLVPSAPPVRLQAEPFPDPPPPYAEVEGWFRAEWTLDEYATPQGQRPNQAERADAVLVPFVATNADVITLRGAVVVARIEAGTVPPSGPTTIFGRVKPLRGELVAALVATVSATGTSTAPRGILIDTLDAPRPAEAWTRVCLVALLALVGTACLWLAARSRPSAHP